MGSEVGVVRLKFKAAGWVLRSTAVPGRVSLSRTRRKYIRVVLGSASMPHTVPEGLTPPQTCLLLW